MGVRSPVWHAEAVKWAIGAAGAQDVESDRIRYDDRPSERFRAVDRKTRKGRRVAGLASAGLDTRLHLRQEDRGTGSS